MSESDASRLEVFIEGDDVYDAMLGAIRSARNSISLETYILADDEVGRPILDALAERARRGVRVRVIADAFGSMLTFPRRTEWRLRRHGVRLRRFHRWQWRDPLRYNRRDHRKLLVVDGRVAFLGGFNIHRENSYRVYGEQRWRDTHVRLTGPLATDIQVLFDAFWAADWETWIPATVREEGVVMSNQTRYARRRLKFFIDSLFEDAEKSIWVSTPYFVPNRRMQQGLVAAARRGVDVQVLVPGKNDVRLVRWASHAAYARLLEGGVRIFEYAPRVLHAKTAVVDGTWAMVGTSNLDYRSFFLNYEVNLFSRQQGLCDELAADFEADRGRSVEVRAEHWGRRHWGEHVAEAIGWWARRWL